MGRVGVLAAVKLDDQPIAIADEVADIPTDRFLPAELRRDVVTNVIPEQRFRLGQIPTEFLGALLRERVSWKPWHPATVPDQNARGNTPDLPLPKLLPYPAATALAMRVT